MNEVFMVIMIKACSQRMSKGENLDDILMSYKKLTDEDKKVIKEALDGLSIDDQVSVLIGPEGGFSDDECILAEENGIQPVLLNTNILRAETASIYAVSAIQAIIQN